MNVYKREKGQIISLLNGASGPTECVFLSELHRSNDRSEEWRSSSPRYFVFLINDSLLEVGFSIRQEFGNMLLNKERDTANFSYYRAFKTMVSVRVEWTCTDLMRPMAFPGHISWWVEERWYSYFLEIFGSVSNEYVRSFLNERSSVDKNRTRHEAWTSFFQDFFVFVNGYIII